ncbi:hypothetical protein [Luteimonas terricola]|uniref:DUF4124 domain-containing protein n=1 Tax=Luteimonas terricola TaxID=645597 RepID=A0ABQ2EF69_9GAMM|nr:hypothetical protein [Luteimonas terricola]GGK05809.1 hypothetical protein GCM10011394_13730 [Luteimonas terricola]
MREASRDGAWLALLLAVGVAMPGSIAPADAQTVQKCIGADGHVTFTSAECADGHLLANTYDAVPEAATNAAAERPVPRQRQTGASSRSGTTARTGSLGTRPARTTARGKSDRCQAARDRREQTLRRVGLKRTFDLLRKLDDEVWAACR